MVKYMKRVVLITGASRGIGAAIAETFANAGYDIAINCLNQEMLESGGVQVAEKCRAYGSKAECFIADVSDFDACEKMVDEVAAKMGGIDVLINNAGITRDGALVRMGEEQFDAVIEVNLKSVFNMTRHVASLMMKKRFGRIINMASVAGVGGNKGQINYAASKAGIIGITKTTAKELGSRNITCNAIAPGIIESAMTASLPDKIKEGMIEATSLKRFGTPQHVADTALFLAENDYITSQVILVDGGLAL